MRTPTEWNFEIERAWAGADWFTARLIRLIDRADSINRERIRLGFPEEVAAYEAWREHGYVPDDWTCQDQPV